MYTLIEAPVKVGNLQLKAATTMFLHPIFAYTIIQVHLWGKDLLCCFFISCLVPNLI